MLISVIFLCWLTRELNLATGMGRDIFCTPVAASVVTGSWNFPALWTSSLNPAKQSVVKCFSSMILFFPSIYKMIQEGDYNFLGYFFVSQNCGRIDQRFRRVSIIVTQISRGEYELRGPVFAKSFSCTVLKDRLQGSAIKEVSLASHLCIFFPLFSFKPLFQSSVPPYFKCSFRRYLCTNFYQTMESNL